MDQGKVYEPTTHDFRFPDSIVYRSENLKSVGIVAVGVAFVMCGAVAQAQQPAKMPRIGWLGVRPAASDTGRKSFLREFAKIGYVEGKNIAIEYRSADDKLDRLPFLAEELVRLKVDVIIAATTPAAVAAKSATVRFRLFFMAALILSHLGWLTAWRDLGGTSQVSPQLRWCWSVNDWNCLKKPFPSSPVLRRCGIHKIQALRNSGKRVNCRHENWVCNFIRSRQAAPTSSRAGSKKRRRPVVALSP